MAYRYRVPGRGRHVVNGEATEWKVPAGSTAFFQGNSRQDYETVWKSGRVGDIKLKDGLALMCPVTFKLAGWIKPGRCAWHGMVSREPKWVQW